MDHVLDEEAKDSLLKKMFAEPDKFSSMTDDQWNEWLESLTEGEFIELICMDLEE